jgi:hypothetical protein
MGVCEWKYAADRVFGRYTKSMWTLVVDIRSPLSRLNPSESSSMMIAAI